MSTFKFTLNIIMGIACGFLVIGVLQWLGLHISLTNVWNKVLGEPSGVSITIVSLMTISVSYFIIHGLYRKYVKSQ